LAPDSVNITLLGFKSRWMIFHWCAFSSALAIWLP